MSKGSTLKLTNVVMCSDPLDQSPWKSKHKGSPLAPACIYYLIPAVSLECSLSFFLVIRPSASPANLCWNVTLVIGREDQRWSSSSSRKQRLLPWTGRELCSIFLHRGSNWGSPYWEGWAMSSSSDGSRDSAKSNALKSFLPGCLASMFQSLGLSKSVWIPWHSRSVRSEDLFVSGARCLQLLILVFSISYLYLLFHWRK